MIARATERDLIDYASPLRDRDADEARARELLRRGVRGTERALERRGGATGIRRGGRAPSGGGGAAPPALPGGWTLDLNGALGLTEISSAYSQWDNQGSAGGNVAQAAPSARAASGRTISGVPAPNFDGTDDWFGSSFQWQDIGDVDGYHGFAVFDLDAVVATATSGYDNEPIIADAGGYFALSLRNNAGSLAAIAYHFSTVEERAVASITTGLHLVEWWYTGAALSIRVDNDAPVTDASAANVNAACLTQSVTVGRDYAVTFRYLNAAIVRILFDDEPRTSDSATVRAALAALYGGAWT